MHLSSKFKLKIVLKVLEIGKEYFNQVFSLMFGKLLLERFDRKIRKGKEQGRMLFISAVLNHPLLFPRQEILPFF